MIDKGIILCNDIIEKIGIEYKKNLCLSFEPNVLKKRCVS